MAWLDQHGVLRLSCPDFVAAREQQEGKIRCCISCHEDEYEGYALAERTRGELLGKPAEYDYTHHRYNEDVAVICCDVLLWLEENPTAGLAVFANKRLEALAEETE